MFEVAHLPYFVAVLFSALTVSVELSLFVCLLVDLFCLFLRQSTMHIPICLAVFWVVYASLLPQSPKCWVTGMSHCVLLIMTLNCELCEFRVAKLLMPLEVFL